MKHIKLAIADVGNCANSLLQGIEYHQGHDPAESAGILHPEICRYRLEDIRVVAAFDIDRRKVGRPLEEAVFGPATAPWCSIASFPPTSPPQCAFLHGALRRTDM